MFYNMPCIFWCKVFDLIFFCTVVIALILLIKNFNVSTVDSQKLQCLLILKPFEKKKKSLLAILDSTLLVIIDFATFHIPPTPLVLNRHYFALPTNPGEQFYMFCTLAAWLINKAGRHFEQPQEYDDPNATISNILSELRSFVSVNNSLLSACSQVMNFNVDNSTT